MEKSQNEPLGPRFKIRKNRIEGTEKQSEESFSPEKIIYIEIDDEITTVFDRIKHTRGKKIALVVPKRAIMLQSIVNLKILKKKTDEIDKEIAIVTSDLAGIQLAEKTGLATATKVFERQDSEAAQAPTPVLRGEKPIRLSGKKLSIAEVIKQDKPDFLKTFIDNIKERIKRRKKQTHETKLIFIAPNKQALFTLILVSALLLLAIAYVALPGATVYITPRSSILDAPFNVTFLDYYKYRDLLDSDSGGAVAIPSFSVTPPVITKKIMHAATGKIPHGQNAKGIITVTNLSNGQWDLAAKTRFQTEDGLIFRTPTAIRIPAGSASAPGTLDVPVEADPFDAKGQETGSRGNIRPSKFFLPGIKNEENRKKLFGESKAPMTGGTTDSAKIVTQEDINAAIESAKKDAAKNAVDELKKYLEQQNLKNKTNLSLLADQRVIITSEPQISLPPDIVGKTQDQFELTILYTARGIAYDRKKLIDALKERFVNRVDPEKKILKINEDDISYRFLDKDDSQSKARLTVTMRAIQIYELDPDKENGQRFIKKITDHILGMKINEAEEYLQQQTDEISSVKITTWPIWAPTIPNIADNVKFSIREEQDLK